MQNIHSLLRAAKMLGLVAMCAMVCAVRPAIAGGIDQVIASVDGNPITMHDVKTFAAAAGKPLPPGDVTSPAFKAALKAVIEQKMFKEEVRKYDDKIEDGQVDRYIQEVEHNRSMTDQQLKESLMQSGVSYDAFRKQVRFELEKTMMFNEEVRQKIDVSPDEVRAYYKEHESDFAISDERYKLAQILIAVPNGATPDVVAAAKARAEALDKKARAGQDFATLARENSDDASKAQGGELGDFKPGEIMNEILDGIKGLQPGQVSGVVRTRYGFHILKVEAHEMPGVKPLTEVQEEIRNKLIDEVAQKRIRDWIENDLVKQHYVETMY